MSYESLKEYIIKVIRPNGNQEITGQLLQNTLVAMVQEMEEEVNLKIEEYVSNFARQNGDYPQMSVGFAQEIVGDGSATEEEFSFRPTAGEERNVANTTYYEGERNGVARIEKIKGNSVVWNQKISYVVAATNKDGAETTYDIENDEVVITNLSRTSNYSSGSTRGRIFPNARWNNGHTYALVSDKKIQGVGLFDETNMMYANVNTVFTANGTNYIILRIDKTFDWATVCPVGESVTLKMKLYDLTQMFGAGNEPTTVEEFYQRLPKGVDINAYNAGEFVDGNYGAIKTVGFNAFNGTYAKVCGGCPYYLGGNYTSLGFATEEGGTTEAITLPTSTESVGTTPSDRLYTPTQDGYIYAEGENININLSWSTEYGYLNGTYQPYKPFERDLSWVARYFPNGMRSAGSVRDEVRFNSTTQKWEAVQNVGSRAYASGDESNSEVTTDGVTTNYALTTPIVTEIEEMPNMDFDVSDYGTEELIAQVGKASAPIVADIAYAPNALSTLKQVPDILARLKQVPDILARLKALEAAAASATSTTNIEE